MHFFGTKSEVIIIEIYGNGHTPSVKQDRNRLDQDQEHASYKKKKQKKTLRSKPEIYENLSWDADSALNRFTYQNNIMCNLYLHVDHSEFGSRAMHSLHH